jgi:hypothetical protein
VDSISARRSALSAVTALAMAGLGPQAAAAAPAQPDLVIKRVAVGVPGLKRTDGGFRIAAGATLRIAERTRNAGGGFARRSTTRYFLRSDDGGMTLIGERAVGTLAPGESSGNVTEPVYGGGSGVDYRLVACADGRGRVAEGSERNNCRTAPGRIVVVDNARPVVFIGGGAATGAFREDDQPVPVDSALTLTDADDANLTGATMQIIGGAGGAGSLAFANDRLFFVEQLGITGTYNSGTGVLTLRGVAPVADYQTALRSVLYRYLGDRPPASRTVRITIRDAKGVPGAPARRTIAITPVNDAPRVFVIVEALPYKSGSGPKPIAPELALLDPDSRIAGARVSISSGFVSAEDELAFANRFGITGSYNDSTGVLTLTGPASPGTYQEALRSVTFASTGTQPRRIAFQATDEQGAPSPPAFVQQHYID